MYIYICIYIYIYTYINIFNKLILNIFINILYIGERCIVMTPHVSQKLQVQLNLFIYESGGYAQALLA